MEVKFLPTIILIKARERYVYFLCYTSDIGFLFILWDISIHLDSKVLLVDSSQIYSVTLDVKTECQVGFCWQRILLKSNSTVLTTEEITESFWPVLHSISFIHDVQICLSNYLLRLPLQLTSKMTFKIILQIHFSLLFNITIYMTLKLTLLFYTIFMFSLILYRNSKVENSFVFVM